jgi:2-hydroxy-3-keto-5-methylthiopentenyl-1-phosphate phosphatase
MHHAVEVSALSNNAHILIHGQHLCGAGAENCLGIGKDHFIHNSRTIRRGNRDQTGTAVHSVWPDFPN